ncbi:MAG: septum formation initiator family protein [Planctomycetota bacterium]
MGKVWQQGEGGVLVWLMVAVGTALLGGLALLPDLQRNQVLAAEIRRLDADIRHLGGEVASLTREKVALESDPVYVERWARKNYNLKRPGEIIRVLKTPLAVAVVPASGRRHLVPWLAALGLMMAGGLVWLYRRTLPGRDAAPAPAYAPVPSCDGGAAGQNPAGPTV